MKKNKETLPFFGIPKLLPYIRPYRKMTICMIILGIGVSLADSLYPLFHQYALDHFILPGTLSGLPTFILMYFGMLAFVICRPCPLPIILRIMWGIFMLVS